MILQPGQGLGFTGSRQIAFGLGGVVDAAVEAVKQGGKFFKDEALKYARIIKEDKEMLDVIIQSFIAGIFDD